MEIILIVFLFLFLCLTPVWIYFIVRCGSYATFLSLKDVFLDKKKPNNKEAKDERESN